VHDVGELYNKKKDIFLMYIIPLMIKTWNFAQLKDVFEKILAIGASQIRPVGGIFDNLLLFFHRSFWSMLD